MPAPLPPVDASYVANCRGWRHGCRSLWKSEQHFIAAVNPYAFSPRLLRSRCNDALNDSIKPPGGENGRDGEASTFLAEGVKTSAVSKDFLILP
jgi:hypothetical protein